MPHSSGGGSHGGGSHGGSHGGGSHGRGTTTIRRSHSYFSGARRYRYTHHGRTKYVYSNSDPSKTFSIARLFIGLFYLPFLIFGFAAIGSSLRQLVPCSDKNILMDDVVGVIYDAAELNDSLESFRDKSGVTPAVVTVYNESWMNSYADLESYAYDRYLSEFSDEKHWLIVYSQPKDRNDPNWFWEGMQGDDTDGVLTQTITARFTTDLQRRLENSDGDVGGEIARAFDQITPTIRKGGILSFFKAIGPGLFVLAFVCCHAYFMLGLYDLKYRNAELDEDGSDYTIGSSSSGGDFSDLPVFGSSSKPEYTSAPVTTSGSGLICDFCGGSYTPGAKRCPHCMAKIDDSTL